MPGLLKGLFRSLIRNHWFTLNLVSRLRHRFYKIDTKFQGIINPIINGEFETISHGPDLHIVWPSENQQ